MGESASDKQPADDFDSQQKYSKKGKKPDYNAIGLLAVIGVLTMLFSPPSFHMTEVSLQHVWFYGWVTAVSTGFGVLPFLFVEEPDRFWVGISNAIAGGMMITASASLSYEGAIFNEVPGALGYHAGYRLVSGIIFGIVFILVTKRVLDQFDDYKMSDINGASTQKMILIVLVMTLHSLTEGVGIGVAFGGKHGSLLGKTISMSLAVHNIPEGMAVAGVLTARGVDKAQTALWAIFTSLPQPIMAVPAYVFVDHVLFVLPFGLGFAAGAMGYVAFFELLTEAVEETSPATTMAVAFISSICMYAAQEGVKTI